MLLEMTHPRSNTILFMSKISKPLNELLLLVIVRLRHVDLRARLRSQLILGKPPENVLA